MNPRLTIPRIRLSPDARNSLPRSARAGRVPRPAEAALLLAPDMREDVLRLADLARIDGRHETLVGRDATTGLPHVPAALVGDAERTEEQALAVGLKAWQAAMQRE